MVKVIYHLLGKLDIYIAKLPGCCQPRKPHHSKAKFFCRFSKSIVHVDPPYLRFLPVYLTFHNALLKSLLIKHLHYPRGITDYNSIVRHILGYH